MRWIAVVVCAVATASARAQPLTGLVEWQVSADAGATWSSALTVGPGQAYLIRALASWTDGPAPSVGLAGIILDQIDLAGADDTDVFGGAAGPGGGMVTAFRIQSPATNWTLIAGQGASAGGLRIHASNPDAAITLAQAFPRLGGVINPDFKRDNPLQVASFTAVAGAPKVLTISATFDPDSVLHRNPFFLYITEAGSSQITEQDAIMAPAIVTIIPAPATLTTAGLLSLFAARRVRRQGARS